MADSPAGNCKKSYIWNFFTRKGNGICQCNLCGKNYKTGGGTTNLKNHLKHKHPSSLKDIDKKTSVTANLFSSLSKKQRSETDFDILSQLSDEQSNFERPESEMSMSVASSSASVSRSRPITPVQSESDISLVDDSSGVDVDSIATMAHDSSKARIAHNNFIHSTKRKCPSYLQPTIKHTFNDQKSYESGGARESVITNSLIYMICKDNLPLGCTEKEGFKKFLKTTVPLYKSPSRKTITSLIEQKYIALQAIIHRKLKNIERIAITTDIATVMNSTRSFIVLTAHYIDDENATFESFCLGVENLTPHHTAVNICNDLNAMLETWGIKKNNIISATTDNGANIVAAINLLLENRGHIPCLAHNINLVVTKALGAVHVQDIVAIIEKVKHIVAYFKHSNTAQDDLRGEQRREGKTDGTFLYLKQEVPTRWNSTFYCLERFILLSGHIGKILLMPTHKKAPPMLTAIELSVIQECLQLLAPFESATKDISGEKYLSGSLVIPLTNCIKLSLQRITVYHDLSQKFKEELSQQIERRLCPQEKNILLGAATMLDPRFKKIHFDSPLIVSNILNRLKTEVREKAQRTDTEKTYAEQTDNIDTTKKNIWSIHEEVAANLWSASDIDNPGSIPRELKLYFEQPTIPRNNDPLRYWTDNKNAYPGTAKVALKYLTTLGASVSSERVVSWLNYVCNDLRSRLTPDHTNQLVFLGVLDNKYWHV